MIYRALGVRPVTFIPPWNRLDTNTLFACQQNGYRIASAGVFTPTLVGLTSLGTDCGLDTFPTALAAVQTVQEQVFLRVLYHSATIRTETEVSELEKAVALAAETKGCEVLTLSEAVRKYPEEVQRANEAARNIVPQDEVADSSRARAVVYRRVFLTVGIKPEVDTTYEQAATLYMQGRYNEACSLSSSIEQACERLLMLGRSIAGSIGLILAAFIIIIANVVLGENLVVGPITALALVSGTGAILYWQATAPDTKREIRTALQAALVGVAASIGLL
jgi:hypothetical protein